MVWTFPEGIEIEKNISDLDDIQLEHYHEQMHVFWERVLEGFQFGWSLHYIYDVHKETVIQMIARGIIHLSPINSLDKIPIASGSKELKKMIKKVTRYKSSSKLEEEDDGTKPWKAMWSK